jgi:CRP-like cAMP-binding protein
MVSNVLGVTPEELVRQLGELRATHASDADYQRLRGDLPADWPI